MSTRAKLVLISLSVVPLGYLVALYYLLYSATTPAAFSRVEFFVKLIFLVAMPISIVLALFSEYLREWLFPIDLCIEDPSESNTVFDLCEFKEENFNSWECPKLLGKTLDVYCHHLQVRNLTRNKPIKGCQIWLTKVLVEDDGKWREEIQDAQGNWRGNKFAVPRLMEWAPAEYSREKRTFCTDQVFDFGKTLAEDFGFMVTIWRVQGGRFWRLFSVGTKVRFYLRVTADNYVKEEDFCVEVDVLRHNGKDRVTPAKIRVIPKHEGGARTA